MSTLTLNITASEPRLGTGCWLDFTRQFTLLYDIGLNPSDTVQDMIISITDLSCLDMFVPKILTISDYEIARAIEALAILLDVQSWARGTDAAGIAWTVAVAVRSWTVGT